MRRIISLFLALASVFVLSSCSSAYSKFHGAWYYDQNGQRDAIQFSVNDDGKEVFIWAKYDIENDSVTSISKGYFHIDGNSVTLDYVTSDIDLTLEYSFDGDKLILSSDTAMFTLTKNVLDE